MSRNINKSLDKLPTHFLFYDLYHHHQDVPVSSLRRWIHTLIQRNKIVRLRRAVGQRNAIYSKV